MVGNLAADFQEKHQNTNDFAETVLASRGGWLLFLLITSMPMPFWLHLNSVLD